MQDMALYAITAEGCHPGSDLIEVMEAALRGGADMLQYRDKHSEPQQRLEKAQALRRLTRRYGVPLIVNDDVELALAAEADGVHLGQGDLPLAAARRRLGRDRLIGISTHALAEAREAEAGGADYIGAGPVYPTGTKPDAAPVTPAYVQAVAAEIRIPHVAIGGITTANVAEVLEAGARCISAVSAIVGSPDAERVSRTLAERVRAHRGEADAARRIMLNGREEQVQARTLGELLRRRGLHGRRLVIELDGRIVPQPQWAQERLSAGARVELVHFVGGG
ncbi:thiamine phosphate synthase [Paenibacillus sp. IB182496]|uniref:Thiamine-phosphate synthase n=1 Tax=Paenibacillus sabuli TaxID=2772509 RepID=A0A927GTT4_9BACL|nr:thiamine phosphate synthase [Paenibacillus sabuli]